MSDDRTIAQFFFEVGYGACFADAYIKNNETPPFEMTDAVVERAWEICPEAYEDGTEFDRYRALADAAPALLEALEALLATHKPGRGQCCAAADKAIAALSLARGETP